MRLTCPNCGAQYEVPDEVIPQDGRDVQCSNCGNTWFQDHEIAEAGADDSPVLEQKIAEFFSGGDDADQIQDDDETYAATDMEAPPELNERVRRPLDASVTDVLREEAAREAGLRASEAATGLQSQPDLGLESAAPEGTDAQIERVLAETVDTAPETHDVEAAAGDRLPSIDEVDTRDTPERAHELSDPDMISTLDATPEAGRNGFVRGFAISLILIAALVLIYANAPSIAQAVPQADPALSAYVASVDEFRLWLNTKLGPVVADFLPQ